MNTMQPETLAWIILALPLVSAVGSPFHPTKPVERGDIGDRRGCRAFVASVLLVFLWGSTSLPGECLAPRWNWLDMGGLQVDLGLTVDSLSNVMLLVVTGVGLVIHIYSCGYMAGRPSGTVFRRAEPVHVLHARHRPGDNFVMMFIFWELVGVSSYLLIGFWYERPAAADAAKKAFLTNRIGDFGFLLGIIAVWAALEPWTSIDLARNLAPDPTALGVWRAGGCAGLHGGDGQERAVPAACVVAGRDGRSDAGQRLIHAATMVAAGVYMLCRVLLPVRFGRRPGRSARVSGAYRRWMSLPGRAASRRCWRR
jgi:NADH-quinone oxidoreductase subunit L